MRYIGNSSRTALADTNTSLTATGATNLELSTADIFAITMSGNCTFTFTNPPPNGKYKQILLVLTQGAGGSKTMTVTGAKYTDNVAPILTTTAGAKDVLSYFTYDGGTTWHGAYVMANIV